MYSANNHERIQLWYIKNLEQGVSLFGNINNNILSLKLNIKIVDIVMRKFIAHKKIWQNI